MNDEPTVMSIMAYLFETVSFLRPIAPKIPSPQPSETFDDTRKYRANSNNGSRAFGLISNILDPDVISSPQITANLASVLNLYNKFIDLRKSIVQSIIAVYRSTYDDLKFSNSLPIFSR